MADKIGAVKLNGKSYRIDLQGYRGRDVTDFAPRASTPGGGMTFSEMNIYQPLNISDWKHGFGFSWHTDASGYLSTEGNIDTRQSGIAMLFPAAVATPTAVPSAMTGIAFQPDGSLISPAETMLVYGRVGTGVGAKGAYVVSPSGALTNYDTQTGVISSDVNFMFSNGTNIFALIDGANRVIQATTNLTVWANTGAATAVDFKWMVNHDGFFFLGKDSTNQVYYDSAVDLSGLQGPTDPGVIYVGPPGRSVKGAVSYNGELMFYREDAMYKMDKDRKVSRKILDYGDVANQANFDCMAVFNGAMYFNIKDRVIQWNGVRVVDVTPPKLNDTFPYYSYTNFYKFYVMGRYMYTVARWKDATNYHIDLIAWDGVAWVKLLNMYTGTSATYCVTDFQYHQCLKQFVYLSRTGGEFDLAATTTINAIPYNEFSEIPAGGFPTTGIHSIYSSRMDAGFRRVIKSTPSIIIEASGLGYQQQYLQIFYSINGAAYQPWGGTNSTTNVVYTNGVTIFKNPLNDVSGKSSIEYYYLQIQIQFISASATKSPVLEGLTVRLIMRPETGYGYAFPIIAAENVEYAVGQTDDRTPYQILTDIRAARDSKKWVEFVDPYGTSHNVYVTSVSEIAVEEHSDETGATPNIEQQIQVNLIEVP